MKLQLLTFLMLTAGLFSMSFGQRSIGLKIDAHVLTLDNQINTSANYKQRMMPGIGAGMVIRRAFNRSPFSIHHELMFGDMALGEVSSESPDRERRYFYRIWKLSWSPMFRLSTKGPTNSFFVGIGPEIALPLLYHDFSSRFDGEGNLLTRYRLCSYFIPQEVFSFGGQLGLGWERKTNVGLMAFEARYSFIVLHDYELGFEPYNHNTYSQVKVGLTWFPGL